MALVEYMMIIMQIFCCLLWWLQHMTCIGIYSIWSLGTKEILYLNQYKDNLVVILTMTLNYKAIVCDVCFECPKSLTFYYYIITMSDNA